MSVAGETLSASISCFAGRTPEPSRSEYGVQDETIKYTVDYAIFKAY